MSGTEDVPAAFLLPKTVEVMVVPAALTMGRGKLLLLLMSGFGGQARSWESTRFAS